MQWRVFYTDKSSFGSEDGSPADAPGGGVVLIGQEDGTTGCRLFFATDLYVYHEAAYGGWAGLDYVGFAQHLIQWREPAIVKMGQCTTLELYREMLDHLREHGLAKVARYPWEPKLP